MRAKKYICYASVVFALLSIPPSLISGVGLVGAVLSLLFAGVVGAMKSIKCAVITCAITTINIFGLSVLSTSADLWKKEVILFLGVPYLVCTLGITVGVFRYKNASFSNAT